MNKNNKNKNKKNKHEFAFYLSNISKITNALKLGDNITLRYAAKAATQDERDVFQRIATITRLSPGDSFILFDQLYNYKIELQNYEKKKSIIGKLIKKEKNKILTPHINFLLPILKKEYFETALYALSELGANSIITLITEKVKAQQIKKERLLKIIIAAAEQSKNFAFPNLEEPLSIEEYLAQKHKSDAVNIFFDPEGENLHEIVKKINYLLNNPNIAKEMGEKSHNFIKKNYSHKNTCEMTFDLYKNMIKKHK